MASTGSNCSVQVPEPAAGRADIVVGLTSYNHAATITTVMRAARDAVASAFGEGAVRFVLADAGSTDGTAQAAREAAGGSPLVELAYEHAPALGTLPYHGQPDRAVGLRAILQAAQQLEARACAVLDAGTPSPSPHWVERLIAPVLADGVDYVSPCYRRHASEGALTKAIVYPMFRALYGVRLRQPAAGEFACSARLAVHYLEQDLWEAEQAPSGIDLWLAVAAASGDFRSCEVIGPARAAAPRAMPADLSTTLAQVVGALFADLEHHVDVWQRVRVSAAIPVFGSAPPPDTPAPQLNVDALTESFRLGYRELREIWTWVLPPRTIVELRRLTEVAPGQLRFDDRLWAGIIYDFAAGYGLRVMPHDHLLRSLTPLYNGWLASFVSQTSGLDAEGVDERLEQLCLVFETEKRRLISRWRWPERLR